MGLKTFRIFFLKVSFSEKESEIFFFQKRKGFRFQKKAAELFSERGK